MILVSMLSVCVLCVCVCVCPWHFNFHTTILCTLMTDLTDGKAISYRHPSHWINFVIVIKCHLHYNFVQSFVKLKLRGSTQCTQSTHNWNDKSFRSILSASLGLNSISRHHLLLQRASSVWVPQTTYNISYSLRVNVYVLSF